MPGSLQDSIDRGLAWVGTATALVAVCDVVALGLILHLWLDAERFGVVSAVVTLLPALTLLAELGLPAALIWSDKPTDDPSDARTSTLFWLTLAAGVLLFAGVAALAPLLAAAQGHAEMTPLLRVAALALLIRPAYLMHRALLRRQLRFRELSQVRMIANLAELVVKLGVAAAGGGVWCLVVAPLARELTYAVGLPAYARWRPRLVCSLRLARADLRFGVRASAGELLLQVYSNLDYQLVAAYFGVTALGLYRAAFELVIEPVRFASEVVTQIAFPAFARLRHDRRAVLAQLVQLARANLALVLPLLALNVLAAPELLTVLIGAGYAPAATAARVLAVVGVLRVLSHLGPPVLDGLGRPDLTLRYHVVAALTLPLAFVLCAELAPGLGYLAIALGWAIGYPLAFAALLVLVQRELALSVAAAARSLARPAGLIALAAAAGAVAATLTPGLGAGPRLAILTALVLGGSWGLLIACGEISPRELVRRLRG